MKLENIIAESGATQIIQVKAEDLQPSFFKTSTYESYKRDPNPMRVPGTCAWFLEHSTFQKWRASSGDNLLWLSADPGCGKSVLSRALIDEKLLGTESATICHFFFKDNDEQNNTATALCALLHQFFCAHKDLLQKHVAPAVEKCGHALKNDFEELWQIFTSAATDPSAGDVICVLDALDECRQSDRKKLITNLEHFYSRSVDKPNQGSKLKFLVTSRPYNEIERGFSKLMQNIPTIRLAGEDESEKISHEIAIVIEAKVRDIAKREGLGEDVRLSLQKRLCEIPNRTYLWLHLTLDELEKGLGHTQRKLLNVINNLPKTVEEAYEKMLARCEQREATKVLQILVAAQRPLTLSEADVALEIGLDSTFYKDLDLEGERNRKKWIRDSCGLFVSIVDSRIFLIHQTAREFLVRKNDEIPGPREWRHSIGLQRAHQVLSEICITYLLFREFQEYRTPANSDELHFSRRTSTIREYAEKYAFLDYSANYWIAHVQEAHIDSSLWVSKTAKLCDIGDGSSCTWFSIYSTSTYFGYGPSDQSKQSALYWAAVLGLIHETRYLLNGDLALNKQPGHFRNALQAAAENTNRGKELVAVFLERGDEVQITEEVVKAAAGNRRNGREVMALLLDRRGDEIQITEEVVKAAAGNWNNGREVMALLLDRRGDEIQITEEVVKAAADNRWNGREVMALLLDQRGDEIQITEEVVKAAAGNWNNGREVMALLLDRRGDEIQITEEVVKAAAGNRWNGREVMALLLDRRGDEIQITEEVVKAAAGNRWNGREVMALLLDRRGSDVQITEEVVKAAAGNWNNGREVMALLLDRREPDAPITEEVVETDAESGKSGKEVLNLFENKLEVKTAEEDAVSTGTLLTSNRRKALKSRKESPFVPAPESFHDSGYGTASKAGTSQARSTGRTSKLSQKVPLSGDSLRNGATQDPRVTYEEIKEQKLAPILAGSERVPQASLAYPVTESVSSPNSNSSGHDSKETETLSPHGDETGSIVSNDTVPLPPKQKIYMVLNFASHLLATVRQDQNDLVLEEKLSEHSRKLFESQLRKYSRAMRTHLKETAVPEPGVTKRVVRAIARQPEDIIAKFTSLATNIAEDGNEIKKPPTVVSNSYMSIVQFNEEKIKTWQDNLQQESYLEASKEPKDTEIIGVYTNDYPRQGLNEEHPASNNGDTDSSDTSETEWEETIGLESIDLEAIRDNLTRHPAFEVLVNQLHNILRGCVHSISSSIPSSITAAQDERPMHADNKNSDVSPHNAEGTAARLTGRLRKGILGLLSHLGLREPDIPPGHKRIRWTNRRGKRLYDDYVEHVPGALHALEGYLRSSVDRSPTGYGHNQGQGAAGIPLRDQSNNYSAPDRGPDSRDIADQQLKIPSENTDGDRFSMDEENHMPESSTMHLISCTETWRWRRGRLRSTIQVHEDIVTNIPDDCQLFRLLKKNYNQHKGGFFWRLVSPRTLKSIDFMKVNYSGPNSCDPRWHDVLCVTGQPCSCIPPTELVKPKGKEYRCFPVPAKFSPPIGPNRMMNAFEDPESLDPNFTQVLQQLPKRICGELQSQSFMATVAWGILYKEGWHWFKIYMFAIFHPVLVFFISYSSFTKDVPGAATVVGGFVGLVTIPVTIYLAQSPSI